MSQIESLTRIGPQDPLDPQFTDTHTKHQDRVGLACHNIYVKNLLLPKIDLTSYL